MISAREAGFISEALGAAAAIATRGRLRIFQALASGPLNSAEVAGRYELAEAAAARLLSALASIGVLDREGGRYRLAVDGGLVESHGALWERLPEVVRGGMSTGFDDASVAAGAYPSVVGFIGALAGQAAPRAAMHLAAHGNSPRPVTAVGSRRRCIQTGVVVSLWVNTICGLPLGALSPVSRSTPPGWNSGAAKGRPYGSLSVVRPCDARSLPFESSNMAGAWPLGQQHPRVGHPRVAQRTGEAGAVVSTSRIARAAESCSREVMASFW